MVRRGSVEVAMNFSAEPRRVAVRGGSLLLATEADVGLSPDGLELPGHSAAVLAP